ncbi:hypothetical protein [Agrobacterium tumefaciens]|uniref:hypothetical protein n=1 Tax=Agrobacterium tumefaciens TaxID=358 RepID=UPI00045ABA8B|nr:hypothetical protein [Agrobacterium tumefaciens]CDN93443.1 hypothetical protein BN949_02597 [Agrobacterium tumefaciens]
MTPDAIPLVSDAALRDIAAPSLVDRDGRTMQLYSFSYRHGDKHWSFSLWAWSKRDAKQRLRALRRNVRLDGLIVAEIEGRN